MSRSPTDSASSRRAWWLLALGGALLALAGRLWLIRHYGTALPYRDEWKAVIHNTLASIPEGEDSLAILKAESVAAISAGLCVAEQMPNVFNVPHVQAQIAYATTNKHLPDILGPSERLALSLLGYYYLRNGMKPAPTGAV